LSIYITTPIYYPNAPPHIGHAYTTIFADVLARFSRLTGHKIFFLTGNDEHGLKLQRIFEEERIEPMKYLDEMADVYKRYWSLLDISYDYFIRTTDRYHEEVVKHCANELYKKGYIYRAKYSGWYCVSCEKFYSEREYVLKNGKPFCPIHDKPIEWIDEETYYFKLSDFREYLEDVLNNRDIVYPRSYALEVLNKIREEGLKDVSIARPRNRVWWGIPLPFDTNYTVYVWFDALLNYISGIGYLRDMARFKEYWSNVHHVIGKDILWFHTAVWFSILKALDIEPPKKLIVHAFLINRGLKIGKSSGNIITIEDLMEKYKSSDSVRYVLMRVFNLDKDVEVSTELFDSIYNSELANNYGNLVRRVGVLAIKKSKGIIYKRRIDQEIADKIESCVNKYMDYMEKYDIAQALNTAMELSREANTYINDVKPWEKAHPDKELYTLLELTRVISILLHPVIPRATAKLSELYGFKITNPRVLEIGSVERFNVIDSPILFSKIK